MLKLTLLVAMATPRITQGIVADALTSPARRCILAAVMDAPRSARAICEATHLPLASVYRNIKCLQAAGLLIVERSAMTEDGKPYDLFRARVTDASLRISARGVEADWTVNPAIEDRFVQARKSIEA